MIAAKARRLGRVQTRVLRPQAAGLADNVIRRYPPDLKAAPVGHRKLCPVRNRGERGRFRTTGVAAVDTSGRHRRGASSSRRGRNTCAAPPRAVGEGA